MGMRANAIAYIMQQAEPRERTGIIGKRTACRKLSGTLHKLIEAVSASGLPHTRCNSATVKWV
jgi:hypothetical protein